VSEFLAALTADRRSGISEVLKEEEEEEEEEEVEEMEEMEEEEEDSSEEDRVFSLELERGERGLGLALVDARVSWRQRGKPREPQWSLWKPEQSGHQETSSSSLP